VRIVWLRALDIRGYVKPQLELIATTSYFLFTQPWKSELHQLSKTRTSTNKMTPTMDNVQVSQSERLPGSVKNCISPTH
jgi:hypothetical protein